MIATFKNVPGEIHSKILDAYLESPSIDFKTLRKMTLVSKTNNSYIASKLNFMKNTNVQYFCKLLHIDNILLIIERSAFDIEKLNDILTFVIDGDFRQDVNIHILNKMCKVSFPESVSIEYTNNTFIILQLLKHTIRKNKNSTVKENGTMRFVSFDTLIDSILFHFFDDLYLFKQRTYQTRKTKSSKKYNSKSKDFSSFSDENLEFSWHMIGFNLYYVYEKNRLLKEQKVVTKEDFKDFQKYITSTNHQISMNSIKYMKQQSNMISDNHLVLIFTFIMSKMIKLKLVHMNDNVKILFVDEEDSFKINMQVSRIYDEFQKSLSFISHSLSTLVKSSPGSK